MATISKLTAIAAATLLLPLVSCTTTGGGPQAVEVDWASRPLVSIKVEGETAGICKDVLGYEYPESAIAYRQDGASRAWEVATQGKHGLLLCRFEVREGAIVSSSVLKSREQRGRQVKTKGFLRQFSGASLSPAGDLNKRIDSITGATVSSKAVSDGALLALRLDAAVTRTGGGSGTPGK